MEKVDGWDALRKILLDVLEEKTYQDFNPELRRHSGAVKQAMQEIANEVDEPERGPARPCPSVDEQLASLGVPEKIIDIIALSATYARRADSTAQDLIMAIDSRKTSDEVSNLLGDYLRASEQYTAGLAFVFMGAYRSVEIDQPRWTWVAEWVLTASKLAMLKASLAQHHFQQAA